MQLVARPTSPWFRSGCSLRTRVLKFRRRAANCTPPSATPSIDIMLTTGVPISTRSILAMMSSVDISTLLISFAFAGFGGRLLINFAFAVLVGDARFGRDYCPEKWAGTKYD